jgi:hypothetical protein
MDRVAVLSPAIPSDTTRLAQYQRETIRSTEKFEEEMVALGLVPATSGSVGGDDDQQPAARRLSRFVNNVDNHFAVKKQKKILNRARNLLLNQEANVCLKEVCTANMLPDVSSFLTINANKRRRRRSSTRLNADGGDNSVPKEAAEDVEIDENEEEGIRRIAAQSKKGECHDATSTPTTEEREHGRVFIFQMPACQVGPHSWSLARTRPINQGCVPVGDSSGECEHDRAGNPGAAHSRGGLPTARFRAPMVCP